MGITKEVNNIMSKTASHKCKCIFSVIMFIAFYLSSCTVVTSNPTSQIVQSSASTNPGTSIPKTFPPDVTKQATNSLFSTITPTLFPTPTPILHTKPIETCLQVQESAAPYLSGILIMQDQTDHNVYYGLDLSSWNSIEFQKTLSYPFISPDGNLGVQSDFETSTIIVYDNKLDLLLQIPDPDDEYIPVGWANNDHLLLDKSRMDTGGPWIPSALIVVDISTGEQQEYSPDYPDFDGALVNDYSWGTSSRLILDPTMKYLVYPAQRNGTRDIILWDISNQKEIIEFFGGDHSYPPQWSSDGSKFIISGPPRYVADGNLIENVDDRIPFVDYEELFLVDVQGDVQRLTFLATYDKAIIDNYKWSPDGTHIAFNIFLGEYIYNHSYDLAVLELNSGEVKSYCIDGYFNWSPDPNYLFVTSNREEDRDTVYLIDIRTGDAWVIAQAARVVGWMVAP